GGSGRVRGGHADQVLVGAAGQEVEARLAEDAMAARHRAAPEGEHALLDQREGVAAAGAGGGDLGTRRAEAPPVALAPETKRPGAQSGLTALAAGDASSTISGSRTRRGMVAPPRPWSGR